MPTFALLLQRLFPIYSSTITNHTQKMTDFRVPHLVLLLLIAFPFMLTAQKLGSNLVFYNPFAIVNGVSEAIYSGNLIGAIQGCQPITVTDMDVENTDPVNSAAVKFIVEFHTAGIAPYGALPAGWTALSPAPSSSNYEAYIFTGTVAPSSTLVRLILDCCSLQVAQLTRSWCTL